jgi:hypothetical protein
MKHVFSLLVTVGLAVSAASAQQVTEVKQPGDVIRVDIKFDGQDADKMTGVSLYLAKPDGNQSKDQVGFAASFGSDSGFNPSAPGTFHAEVRIPKGIASGDYILYVNAQCGAGSTQYVSGRDFQLPPFHIRNGETFRAPKITVTEKP